MTAGRAAALERFARSAAGAEARAASRRSGPAGIQRLYLLTDRDAGNLATISLWGTWEDVRRVEARAAQVRSEAAESTGVAQPAKI